MAKKSISININGAPRSGEVEDRLLLVHFIRDDCSLTGTHIGCDSTHCGACTVLLDGTAVKSCTVFAVQADGRDVMTIEGMEGESLHPLQEGFYEEHGINEIEFYLTDTYFPGLIGGSLDIAHSDTDVLFGSAAASGKPLKMLSVYRCLLYTSPSPRDRTRSRMPSSA